MSAAEFNMNGFTLDDIRAASPAHFQPVVDAMGAGVAFLSVLPGIKSPTALLPGRPSIILIGDDPTEGPSLGPAAFDAESLKRLAGWSRMIIIHAAGGEALHYQMLVGGAVLTGCSLMIETQTAHLQAWIKWKETAAPHAQGLIIAPGANVGDVGHA